MAIRVSALTVLLLIVTVGLASNAVAASYEITPNEDALVAAIKERNLDRLVFLLNEIKGRLHHEDVLPLVKAIWSVDKRQYPELPWDFLRLDIVRINAADILVQDCKNHLVQVNLNAIRRYARSLLDNPDQAVKMQALFVLGRIGEAGDVAAIRTIAVRRTTNSGLFRACIVSLAMMCNSQSSVAIEAIRSSTDDTDRVAFIDTTRKQFSELKAQGGLCPGRKDH